MEIRYKNYPLSRKLTQKSRFAALATHPVVGMAIGAVPGLICAFLLPDSVQIPLAVMAVGIVAGLILAPRLHKKLDARYDAEYEKLRAQKQQTQ